MSYIIWKVLESIEFISFVLRFFRFRIWEGEIGRGVFFLVEFRR